MRNILITGITGQDGAYLAQHMLKRGDRVWGAIRRSSSTNLWRLEEVGIVGHPNLTLVDYDLIDLSSSCRLLERVQPELIFNLAAQSFVEVSFDQPVATALYTGLGPLHLLEAMRLAKSKARFYQASSSEMYGKVQAMPQDEDTPFYPRSPYAAAKLYAHWMTVNYRESFGMFATSGILFNHESPLRGREFVTRKITDGAARIALGRQEVLELGNLEAKRDWGHAREYVVGMLAMLEHSEPDTFVLATNKTHTVRSFVELAFAAVDIRLEWRGQGVDEVGVCTRTGATRVRVNPRFFRPAEVDLLIGDFRKAEAKLGWRPEIGLDELCREMVEADLRRIPAGASY